MTNDSGTGAAHWMAMHRDLLATLRKERQDGAVEADAVGSDVRRDRPVFFGGHVRHLRHVEVGRPGFIEQSQGTFDGAPADAEPRLAPRCDFTSVSR